MSDNSWELWGVDLECRRRAEEGAARLGVSVADHLSDLVVRRVVLDQLSVISGAEQTQSETEEAAIFAPPPESREGFAVRQRLKTLERRLGAAVGSLDGAIHALDTSLFDATARLGDVEALAGDTAHALGQTQQDVSNAVAGVQVHLAVLEDNIAGQDRRLESVERSAYVLAGAQEALKHAVADDFTTFTHETADRLNASLAELRAAADAATAQADAAVAHLVNELRSLRASIDNQLEHSAEITRDRMHAAFADAADRMAALAVRVTDNERFVSRTAEQLRAQMTDVEDGAQAAIEETANALRTADAVLAADLARAGQEQYAALEAARSGLASQVSDLREEQITQLKRLNVVDVAVGNTVGAIEELRDAVERRVVGVEGDVRGTLQQANADWDQRFDALTARLTRGEQQTQHLQQRLGAELDRIETSNLAALEKLRRDISADDAQAIQRLEAAFQEIGGELEEVRNRAVNEVHLLRDEHASAQVRLSLLDTALTRLEGASISNNTRFDRLESVLDGGDPELEARIAQLEYAAANGETDQALAIVRSDVEALTDRLDTLYADTALADRLMALQRGLEAQETRSGELSESLQDLDRTLNRVAAQSAETAERAEDRAQQIDAALADLRLEALPAAEANPAADALHSLQERVAAFELLQASALETLRADIARFVADNDGRLEALESRPASAPQGDLAAEFESLRARIEERVLNVEVRSVRTLERVVDTVALLEQRLLNTNDNKDQAVKSA